MLDQGGENAERVVRFINPSWNLTTSSEEQEDMSSLQEGWAPPTIASNGISSKVPASSGADLPRE